MVTPLEDKKAKKKSADLTETKTKKPGKAAKGESKKIIEKKPAKKGAAESSPAEKKKNLPAKSKAPAIKKIPPKKNKPVDQDESNELEIIDPEASTRGDNPMTVVDHLDEFRSRILIVLGVLITLTFVNFYFSEHIVNYINKPFLSTGNKLNVFKLTSGFIIRLKASAGTAILMTFPLIIFHIWRYILPAIDKKERMFSRLSIIASVVLFYSGVAFVFFLLLPLMIEVLLSFIPSEMLSTIGADDYLSFIFLLCLAMGIIFELPVIILVLTKLGLITPAILISKRKLALIIIWVFAAIITPPDPLSQSLVAVPLMFLYEFSILISRFIVIRKKKKEILERR